MTKILSLKQAIRHFQGLGEAIDKANAIGVLDGSELMLRTAREIVGVYQRQNTGSAAPWAELADATKQDRVRAGYSENDPGYRSGEMEQSYGVRASVIGPLASSSIGSDDPKALWFERGTTRFWTGTDGFYQPPRAVLEVAAFRTEEKVVHGVIGIVMRALEGRPLPNRSATDLIDQSE